MNIGDLTGNHSAKRRRRDSTATDGNFKHVHNATELNDDQTSTKMIRKQYSADMYKRFRTLKGLIRDTIQKFDALNLKDMGVTLAEAAKNFMFTQDARKVQAFMDWLDQAESDEILEIIRYDQGRVAQRKAWQNVYVRRAYEKGIKHANRQLSQAGQAIPEETMQQVFNKPIHADALGVLYTRNFNELQGITQAMNQQISRELASGFAQGQNPRKIAGAINDRVDKVGITRARTLARTETIRAHAISTKNRYKEYGVQKVNYIWGRGPCPTGICPDHAAGGPYKIGNAPMPVADTHPNCTCTLNPVV